MPASPARKRRHQEKMRAERERLAKKAAEEQLLRAVPDPAPEPPAEDEVNFLLPPGGMMGGRSVPLKKSLIVPAPLNAHLLMFQARYQGRRYKVGNGSLALWRVLLREEHEMVERAKREAKKTGLPPDPEPGPLMRRWLDELDRMDAEESGDIFDE